MSEHLKELEDGYQEVLECCECAPVSRLEYLSEYVFDFTTYESGVSELFARKAVEVCKAITDRKTFEYIESQDGRIWYLLMCNMPFFAERIEWGTSIRGAWWDARCGLDDYIQAIIEFAQPEMDERKM